MISKGNRDAQIFTIKHIREDILGLLNWDWEYVHKNPETSLV